MNSATEKEEPSRRPSRPRIVPVVWTRYTRRASRSLEFRGITTLDGQGSRGIGVRWHLDRTSEGASETRSPRRAFAMDEFRRDRLRSANGSHQCNGRCFPPVSASVTTGVPVGPTRDASESLSTKGIREIATRPSWPLTGYRGVKMGFAGVIPGCVIAARGSVAGASREFVKDGFRGGPPPPPPKKTELRYILRRSRGPPSKTPRVSKDDVVRVERVWASIFRESRSDRPGRCSHSSDGATVGHARRRAAEGVRVCCCGFSQGRQGVGCTLVQSRACLRW